jgi:hypothetical protein
MDRMCFRSEPSPVGDLRRKSKSQPTDGMTGTRVTIRHVLNFPVCVENRGLADTDKVDPAPPARTGSVPISPAGTPFSGDPAARAGYRIPDQNR